MKARILFEMGETHRNPEDFQYVALDTERRRLKAAVGDWASNLVGGPYEDAALSDVLGKPRVTKYNGGFIGANVARNVIESTDDTGYRLVTSINRALARKYEDIIARGHRKLTGYRRDRALTFTGYIAHLIAMTDQMTVTAVGDVRLAADGKVVAGKTKEIDIYHPLVRQMYIDRYGDTTGGFKHIRPLIVAQFQHQNTPGHPLSYPAIDGTETLPIDEVQEFVMPTPRHVLMWSDAYIEPDEFTLEGLERKLAYAYKIDPGRYLEYPSVGIPLDDRTIVEITGLDDWSRLDIEEVRPLFYRKQ